MGAAVKWWYTWQLSILSGYLLLCSSSSLLLGISPQDEKYYLEGAVIACRDGSKSFPRSRLNDGFCDCPDGTDEPGTSACPESKFYCRNVGDTPRFLFSSRVNDNICDCCDGSDEYDGGILCPNTCQKDGNEDQVSEKLENVKDRVSAQKTTSRVDLDLLHNLKGFRVAVIVESVTLICMVTLYVLCRRNRTRRRRLSRN